MVNWYKSAKDDILGAVKIEGRTLWVTRYFKINIVYEKKVLIQYMYFIENALKYYYTKIKIINITLLYLSVINYGNIKNGVFI